MVHKEFRQGIERAKERFDDLSEFMSMDVTVEEAADALETYLMNGDQECAFDALVILRMLCERKECRHDEEI